MDLPKAICSILLFGMMSAMKFSQPSIKSFLLCHPVQQLTNWLAFSLHGILGVKVYNGRGATPSLSNDTIVRTHANTTASDSLVSNLSTLFMLHFVETLLRHHVNNISYQHHCDAGESHSWNVTKGVMLAGVWTRCKPIGEHVVSI